MQIRMEQRIYIPEGSCSEGFTGKDLYHFMFEVSQCSLVKPFRSEPTRVAGDSSLKRVEFWADGFPRQSVLPPPHIGIGRPQLRQCRYRKQTSRHVGVGRRTR